MSLSPSAIATLLILIFAGPLCWAAVFVYKFFRPNRSSPEGDDEGIKDDRESVSSSDYLFAMIGYAIGIGNVWRFPYVIAQNGGGAAVIAYLVSAVLVAIPLFLLELIMGQHTRLSTIKCYEMIRPRWRSLGYAHAIMVVLALSYYQILLGYSCLYIVSSCQDPLPWSEEAYKTKGLSENVTAAEAFWENEILNRYEDLDGKSPGAIQSHLVTALAVVWIMCFLAIAFGKKVLAKVTTVTVVSPIILMLVLLVRAVTLEGAREGIDFYIGKVQWDQLLEPTVWATCCGQILFSLSPGFGTAITMSSFTKKKEDVFRACWIVAVSNSLFSIVGGFAVFSVIGNLAWRTDRTVEDVADRSGAGLAFITMAEAMTFFGGWANAMAVLFFTMLLSLGLDSSFAWLETVVSYVADFLHERELKAQRWVVVLAVSVSLFLLGLPFTTRMGLETLDVIDHFAVSIFLLFSVFLESIMISVDFTWERIAKAIKDTTAGNKATPNGRDLNPYFWRFCLYVTIPLATAFLCGYLLAEDLRTPYGDYPSWLLAIGWSLLGLQLLITPLTLWQTTKGALPPLLLLQPAISPCAPGPTAPAPAPIPMPATPAASSAVHSFLPAPAALAPSIAPGPVLYPCAASLAPVATMSLLPGQVPGTPSVSAEC